MQIGWIPDHRWDLAADFRAFYHLSWREAVGLPGPEFFALAYRCASFAGVMQARVTFQESRERRNVRKHDAKIVQGDRSELLADPLLRDVIDFG